MPVVVDCAEPKDSYKIFIYDENDNLVAETRTISAKFITLSIRLDTTLDIFSEKDFISQLVAQLEIDQ